MINENDFVQNAALKLCANLDIENALHSTLLYIQDHVPADAVFLLHLDPALGAMRTIAQADLSRGQRANIITPLRDPRLDDRYIRNTYPPGKAIVTNAPLTSAFDVAMIQAYGYDERSTSLLGMMLLSETTFHGGVIFVTDAQKGFSDDHARLISSLAAPLAVALKNSMIHREVVQLRDKLADDNRYMSKQMQRLVGDVIVGGDSGLRAVMKQVRQVAPTDSPVLLTGETGTGKDVIANAIHLASARHDGPFIAVNCGAIPDALLDSELFGHEKGAFTGALKMKRGRFERAEKGTILLDEIGEMPMDAQIRLLRVIQNREIERVGGSQSIPVDIRIIAATNKNLMEMVKTGRFREDLWFRLHVFPIIVPPLRDRLCDLSVLVQHFMDRKAVNLKYREAPSLASGALDSLMSYHWPGNVRELENVVERAMILHRGEPLRFDDLGTPFSNDAPETRSGKPDGALELDTVIKQHITHVLGMTGGKVHGPCGAAELLGVNANTLRYRMEKLDIRFGRQERAR